MSMNIKPENRRLLESLEHIDEKLVLEALGDLKVTSALAPKEEAVTWKTPFKHWKRLTAMVACLVLLSCAIPLISYVLPQLGDAFSGSAGAGSSEIEAPTEGESQLIEAETTGTEAEPEYDGSRGLLYAVNEDGKTASMIGFGTCKDEVMYVASHYDGLPVTVMKNLSRGSNRYVKRIVVSDTVEAVWDGVISLCANIESVYLGANVDSFSIQVFNGANGKKLTSIEVSPENKNYSSKGNCLVDLRTKELVLGLLTTVIPDDGSVEIIGQFAFDAVQEELKSIVIPEGVKVLNVAAFLGCSKLESVILPESLEVIEISAFGSCMSLKTLHIGKNLKAFNQYAVDNSNHPEIYYDGTVAQWEAIAKPSSGNIFASAPVHCTDGESLSNAGNRVQYAWQTLPEFSGYWERHRPTPVYPEGTE